MKIKAKANKQKPFTHDEANDKMPKKYKKNILNDLDTRFSSAHMISNIVCRSVEQVHRVLSLNDFFRALFTLFGVLLIMW